MSKTVCNPVQHKDSKLIILMATPPEIKHTNNCMIGVHDHMTGRGDHVSSPLSHMTGVHGHMTGRGNHVSSPLSHMTGVHGHMTGRGNHVSSPLSHMTGVHGHMTGRGNHVSSPLRERLQRREQAALLS